MADAEAGDARWLLLERAREELLAAFAAKGEADRRYLRAILAYDAAAEACRALRRTGDTPPRPRRTRV